jgi:hypothetical protein
LADYVTFDDVEAALATAASGPYAAFTTLITLPNKTWELLTCHAIKIGKGVDAGRPGVFFLGGIHADEWVCPDILVNFIELLQAAYVDPTRAGITLGGKSFSYDEIQRIVDRLDIYVFPLANPDGRKYNRASDYLWRKNRRPADPTYNCIGVDLNRNFDFLWDYQSLMKNSPVLISDYSCSRNYRGPSPFSEPETLNVKWIHDTYPNIGYFVDLHSEGAKILYCWGDDDNQTEHSDVDFRNATFNDVRGLPIILPPAAYPDAAAKIAAEAYGEYIPSEDLDAAQLLAGALGAAIQAVRNVTYKVQQSVVLFPTAGTSDDYAYSRHIVDSSKRKVMAFTIECGAAKQPTYVDMQDVQDVTSGLIAFCLAVCNSIQACALTIARDSFAKDEVDAMLATSATAQFDAAFYVVIDGFRHEDFGITAATLTGIPNVQPTVTFSPPLAGVTAQATACSAEGNTLVQGPQRFTWTFALSFSDTSDFTQETLSASMNASLLALTGVTMSAQALIALTVQPKPYEIDGQVAWLSVDLQVCQVLENGSLPSTPAVTLNAGPNDFIGRLLAAYNDPALPRAPGHPFDLDLVASQASSTVEIAGSVGSPGTPVYNFALARVRYRAVATPASNVRVFFRMFQAATTSTEYQPGTTYLTGGTGGNRIPLPGVVGGEIVTIPFFADPRVDPTNPDGLDAQTDPPNVGPLGSTIPPDASGAEVQVYFGCWLDINQDVPVLPAAAASTTGPFVPVRSIQEIVKGKHQCLVAEIQLDPPAPQIPSAAGPGSCDRLAQRNLTIVGVASPHLVPVTFDIRPTDATLRPGQTPDELMIDWGDLPLGATATIFLPGVKARTVVEMADRFYWHHELTKLDDHTLSCRAAGISYVPIPPGVGSNHAGLMTIEVPATVRKGQEFKVIAQQITRAIGLAPGRVRHVVAWRRIRGSFQVSIPVMTKAALLEPERRLLSVLRFIATSIPPTDRWHPVFHRYLAVVAGRVNALGGNADRVGASTKGDWRAAARCRNFAVAAATILAAAITSLGMLTGVAIVVAPPILALLLVVMASSWISRCSPGATGLSRSFLGGVGLAGTILAILALSGWSAPQLVPVLCSCVIVLAATVLIGRFRRWF